jgi:hypothetical protein
VQGVGSSSLLAPTKQREIDSPFFMFYSKSKTS